MEESFLYPFILSDESLKSNIKDLDIIKSLTFVLSLEAKSFIYNQRESIGFIAQEEQQLNKHCVISSKLAQEKGKEHKNLLSLSYNDLFIHNINAMKGLVEIIEAQHNKILELTERLEHLETKINNKIEKI